MLETGICKESTYADTVRTHLEKQLDLLAVRSIQDLAQITGQFCADAELAIARNSGILRSLSRTYRLGIVSNNYGNTHGWCVGFGIEDLLDPILDSTIVGARKPNPAIFENLLSRWNTNGSSVIFVGDNYDLDIIGAKEAGFTTVWISAECTGQTARAADYIVPSVCELPALLRP
ncbi:MAG: HAD family hydrolase [Acidobacteria bacterium]|nr:HAD family hydrolase [Acidobacteriota bacterium]